MWLPRYAGRGRVTGISECYRRYCRLLVMSSYLLLWDNNSTTKTVVKKQPIVPAVKAANSRDLT